jgi:cytochrome P450
MALSGWTSGAVDRVLARWPAVGLVRDPIGSLVPLAGQSDGLAVVRVGPKRLAIVGDPSLAREVLVVQHRSLSKGGTVAGLRMLLGDGLITADGPRHQTRRRAVAPAFAASRLPDYAPAIVRLAAETAAAWDAGSAPRLHDELLMLSLRIACRSFLSVDPGPATRELFGHADTLASLSGLASIPGAAGLARTPIPPARRFREARAGLESGVERLLVEHARFAPDEPRPDALCLVGDPTISGRTGDPHRMRDEAMTMLIAGHVTVASAISWSLLLLGGDATWAARVRHEVRQVIGDRPATADDVPRLPVMRAVLAEAMRLYPPAWAIGREVTTPVRLGGRQLPPGTTIIVSPWILGRAAASFPEPEVFDPGRWLGDRDPAIPRHAYIPFGLGPRRCLGEGFAWQGGVLVLATLLQTWAFEPVDGMADRLRPGVTLNPPGGARMRISRPD